EDDAHDEDSPVSPGAFDLSCAALRHRAGAVHHTSGGGHAPESTTRVSRQSEHSIRTGLGARRQERGAVPVGGNVRVSQSAWDPEEPDQTIGGVDQMACAAHQDPCATRAFIGDYFGLAISNSNVYTLAVSTHYPSGVTADGGGPVYYQQQVLET